MLQVSYQALIARDAVEPQVLVDGSFAETVSTRQRLDSVWARWDEETVPTVEVELRGVEDAALAVASFVDTSQIRGRVSDAAKRPTARSTRPHEDVERLPSDVASLAHEVRRIAANRSDDDESTLSLADLSQHVGRPVAKLRADLEAISDASSLDLY
jgi:hypothetical protein